MKTVFTSFFSSFFPSFSPIPGNSAKAAALLPLATRWRCSPAAPAQHKWGKKRRFGVFCRTLLRASVCFGLSGNERTHLAHGHCPCPEQQPLKAELGELSAFLGPLGCPKFPQPFPGHGSHLQPGRARLSAEVLEVQWHFPGPTRAGCAECWVSGAGFCLRTSPSWHAAVSLVLGTARLGVLHCWARGGQAGPQCGYLVPQKQEPHLFLPKAGPRGTEQQQNSPEPSWNVWRRGQSRLRGSGKLLDLL